MKSLLIVIIMMMLTAFAGMTALMCKWANEINQVLVPAHVSLDTTKYKILKVDSLIIDGSTTLTGRGMKIKRIYYLIK